MLILDQIARLVRKCAKKNIVVCLIKGSALLYDGIYAECERDMEDIDILVRPQDLAALEQMLDSMGYRKVCSGEIGYYKEGCNAVLDIHTDLLYADKEQTESVWKRMLDVNGAKVMDPVDHIIYIVHHAVVHHGTLSGYWQEDCKRLLNGIEDMGRLIKKAHDHGLGEVFHIAAEKIGIETVTVPDCNNLFKLNYIKLMLSLPEYPEKGHFLRFITVRSLGQFLAYVYRFFFPGVTFLKRRYSPIPSVVMIFLRPPVLVIKALYGVIYCSVH